MENPADTRLRFVRAYVARLRVRFPDDDRIGEIADDLDGIAWGPVVAEPPAADCPAAPPGVAGAPGDREPR